MVPAATAQPTTLIEYFAGRIVFNARPAEADFTDNCLVHRSRRGDILCVCINPMKALVERESSKACAGHERA
jgi:hypothetical protein